MRSDWYLYVKFRETFEPFYVGIGSSSRPLGRA